VQRALVRKLEELVRRLVSGDMAFFLYQSYRRARSPSISGSGDPRAPAP
jgi:hypothetical protein